ncbi:MAG: hypothetical protein PUC65_06245 [Clostridiales bacterium]|nr:hypothetical protein [Clostridiales bacterium]
MVNPKTIFELKSAWSTFDRNHPRFQPFLMAARQNIKENSIIEISIKSESGESICTNLKITESDLALFEKLKQLQG